MKKLEYKIIKLILEKKFKVAADKDYYFVLWVENNDYVQWNYNPALKASAYSLNGDNWDSHDFDFELDILPLYSGDYRVPLMTIGDKNIGIQEIPSLDQICNGCRCIVR